jgi:penicillin-binding protein 1A
MARRAAAKPNRRPPSRAARTPARPSLLGAIWRRLGWLLTGPIGLALLIVAIAWYVSLDVDDLRRPVQGDQPSITLLDREGVRFASFGRRQGDWLTLDQMSKWVPEAVVAIEDRRFWQHPGLDPIGIFRALVRNLEAGRVVEGGSTISQQLAKLVFLTPERTLTRKVKEALYTIWLEARLDKRQILEAYLNRIYLGAGVYGIDAAAERYFDKPASALSLAESAMLAGLIKAPSRYAPTRDLNLAQERAGVVIDALVANDALSSHEARIAKDNPATLAEPHTRADTGYFADWVAAETRLYAGPADLQLVVRTTLDPDLQRAAEGAVGTWLDARSESERVGQAALVAMSRDGRVRAMLGGRSYARTQYNRATQAERQPGSAFKLFVYLAALESGLRPDDVVSGAPVVVDGWQPGNFNGRYPESLTLADSFAKSVNTAAVRVSEQVGRQNVIEVAERLGITSKLRPEPSLALGTSEVSLLELTAAYGTIANQGRLVWPVGIERVAGAGGRILYQHRAFDEPVLEPAVVRAMTAMLQVTMSRGTGRNGALRRFAAGKTGTSADYRDAWFVGFTDEIVVGVWVGNDDGSPMNGVTGGGLPARIFREFILRAYGDTPFLPPPPPPKPWQGSFPVAAVKDVLGDAIEDLFASVKRLFGG